MSYRAGTYPFCFDKETVIEAILYIAPRVPKATLHTVFKTLYFADKEHLERFGSMITGDKYIAMKYGPVPSDAYDLVKMVRGDDYRGRFDEQAAEAFGIADEEVIVPHRSPDEELFSDSELDCLAHAIEVYGGMSFDELVAASHDDSWYAAGENRPITLDALTEGMRDRELLLDYLKEA